MTPRRVIAIVLALALAVLAWAGAGALRSGLPRVPAGDVEIAVLHAATSAQNWNNFVAGAHRAAYRWPDLAVDDSRAFSAESTAIPELVLSVRGRPGKLRARWYKLTSDRPARDWVDRLAARPQPPLAFVGGSTSSGAEELARALSRHRADWADPPLLLLTTATAENVEFNNETPPLIELYNGRTFRFCFTNRQMARSVLNFVWSRDELRPHGDPTPVIPTVALASGDPWGALILAAWSRTSECPALVSALEWEDNPYSGDLSSLFLDAIREPQYAPVKVVVQARIPYSVGGLDQPNKWEGQAAERLSGGSEQTPFSRQLLILPASANPARRTLRALVGASPLIGRNLVAVSGDAISFNTVYRDAGSAWPARAVPVPLVFALHQNPSAWDWTPGRSGERPPHALEGPTATDEVLLNADLVQRLSEASVEGGPGAVADALLARNDFFHPNGDRRASSGLHVVWFRPTIDPAGGVSAEAVLEIWSRASGRWVMVNQVQSPAGGP